MTIPGYWEIYYFSDYSFECPVGVWRARLDAKAWGKQRNILLFFTEIGTDKKYCVSVFRPALYRPLDGSIIFKTAAEMGDIFELETAKTRTGRTKFLSAKKMSEPSAEIPETLALA